MTLLHICATTILVGTSVPPTAYEKKIIDRAKWVCVNRYKKCTKSVTQKLPRDWEVICGELYGKGNTGN